MKKVYLGGTCNQSRWRDELIDMIDIDYYNPIVDNWTERCQEEEIRQQQLCDYLLYVITPEMTGVYSIAQVVDGSNKSPDKTLLCVMPGYHGLSFSESQLRSLKSVEKMVKNNGARVFDTLESVAAYLNKV